MKESSSPVVSVTYKVSSLIVNDIRKLKLNCGTNAGEGTDCIPTCIGIWVGIYVRLGLEVMIVCPCSLVSNETSSCTFNGKHNSSNESVSLLAAITRSPKSSIRTIG